MYKKASYKVAFPIMFLIIGIWIGGWFFSFTPEVHSVTNQPVNDIFNSLNALFAGLAFGGVILTVYLQIEELEETREELSRTSEANQMMAEDSKEKAVLDLYLTYCSEYFQEVKSYSMKVLIGCIKNKEYCNFVVSRFFVAAQLPMKEDFYSDLKDIFGCSNYDEFVREEQKGRFKLDELINFFSVLTSKVNSKEIIGNCDFFYAWWRPLFWTIALIKKERYQQYPEISEYHGELLFPGTVQRLDDIYGFSGFKSDTEAWSFIMNHPKVKSYGIDDRYHKYLNIFPS